MVGLRVRVGSLVDVRLLIGLLLMSVVGRLLLGILFIMLVARVLVLWWFGVLCRLVVSGR